MKKILLIVPAAAVLAACGSVHPVAAPTHSAPPPATYSAPPAPAYTPPPVSPLQSWWDNGGSSNWSTVESDLSTVQTDANNGDQISVMTDGATLRTDALAAAKDHPPWAYDKHAYYFGAMGAMAFAGLEMQYGNWTKATSFMQTANSDVVKFVAEAQAEGLTVSTGY